jgi:hypothetical protein
MGEFTGAALKRCVEQGCQRVTLAGMVGKFSKLAQGHFMTHVAGNRVDLAFLASVAAESGASGAVQDEIRAANTARHFQEIALAYGLRSVFDRIAAEVRERLGAARLDTYISCLGTTLQVAGSREAFIAVDRDLVLRLAKLAFGLGARRAILVSSVGASRQSGTFYLRIKGEVEDAMGDVGFQRLDILQPGLLLGERGEVRRGEAIAQTLAPIYNPLLRGRRLRRYRAIDAGEVARAIVRLSEQDAPGRFVHENDEIAEWAATGAPID